MAKKRDTYNWVISSQLRNKMKCVKAIKHLAKIHKPLHYNFSFPEYIYIALKFFIVNRESLKVFKDECKSYLDLLLEINKDIKKIEITSNGVIINDTYLVRSELARYLKHSSFKASYFSAFSYYQDFIEVLEKLKKSKEPSRYLVSLGISPK